MAKVTETRTKERIKQTGEVFTPPELVNEILGKLPQELFTDPTKTFIDPAAGDGNFIIEVLKRKMLNGSTSLEALSTTYAVELMQDNVNDMHERIITLLAKDWTPEHDMYLIHNYICANSLEHNYDNWMPLGESPDGDAKTVASWNDLMEF